MTQVNLPIIQTERDTLLYAKTTESENIHQSWKLENGNLRQD
jgi:hypothetical protein